MNITRQKILTEKKFKIMNITRQKILTEKKFKIMNEYNNCYIQAEKKIKGQNFDLIKF